MKKIFLGLLALAVTLAMTILPTGSASAATYWTETHCKSHTSLLVFHVNGCIEVGWRVQDDGTGIRLEDAWAWPHKSASQPHPCLVLTSPVYPNTTFWASATSNGIMESVPQHFKPKTECRHHFDLEIKVPYNSNRALVEADIDWNMKGIAPTWHEVTQFYVCKGNTC